MSKTDWQDWQMDEKGYMGAARQTLDRNVDEVDRNMKSSLILSLMGNVNAGKSSLINAVLDADLAKVKSVPGWTKDVQLYPFPGFPNVYVADTPGLEDIDADVASRALEFVARHSDVVIFVLNGAVGLTKSERDAVAKIRKDYPVVVALNKIDVVSSQEREDLLTYVQENLDPKRRIRVIATSTKTGEGIDELTSALLDLLAKRNKDLLFAKVARHKDAAVDRWIAVAAGAGAGIGAIPIPGSDILPLTALQTGLIIKIAKVYDVPISKDDAALFLSQVVVGPVGRTIFRQLLKVVGDLFGPVGAGAAAVIAAGVAAAMTYGVGRAAKEYYKRGMALPIEDVRRVYEMAAKSRGAKKLGEWNEPKGR